MKKIMSQQRGIGLLELMLALAISAILIIVSVQYFNSTKNSTYVNAVVQEVETIMSVGNGLTDPAGSVDSSQPSNGNLTNAIILSGSIPKQYISSKDIPKDQQTQGGPTSYEILVGPWGKSEADGYFTVNYTAAAGGIDAYITITGINLPDYGCKSLESQFMGAPNLYEDPNCNLTTNTFTLSFYFASGDPIKVEDFPSSK